MNFKVRAILGAWAVVLSLNAGGINISTEGGGTVFPDLNGKNLIGGRTYTLTAKPRAGYNFEHWTVDNFYYGGHHEYDSPKLSLTLLNGLLYVKNGTNYDFVGPFDSYFTANFTAKPIVPGTYIGINTDTVTIYSSFRVSANGTFSAKVFFGGEWHRFSGKFSEDGTAQATVRVENKKVGITLYTSDGGISADSDPYDPDSPLNWLSAAVVSPVHDPRITTYYGGKYTVTIMGGDNDPSVPKGDGFATVSINRTGRLLAVGKLADGTAFTQSIALPDSLEWPIFLVFKSGAETLAGAATFFLSSGPIWGSVTWEKSQQTNDLSYPEGFKRELGIDGSLYLPPNIQGNQILEINNPLISFDGGTLPIHFAVTSTVASDYRIVVDDPTNQIAMSIDPRNGFFKGSVTPPGQSDPIRFQGVVVQRLAGYDSSILYGYYGSGFFLHENLSGRIKIVAPPPPLGATITSSPTNLYAGYSGGFTGLVDGSPTAYFWDFGDGTIVSNTLSVSHAWMQDGDFEVKLRAFDDANQAGVTATCQVHVIVPPIRSRQVFYEDVQGNSLTAPRKTSGPSSWSKKASNL